MSERVIVVDENDYEVGVKERSALTKGDIYRVSALWLENSKGEVLLAQRSLSKKQSPGLWGPAAAGTVAQGETYESNIIKEAKEELGIDDIEPVKLFKIKVSSENIYFCYYFKARIDKPVQDFTLQKQEVEKVRWVGKDELLKDIRDHPERYVSSARSWNEYFF